MIKIFKNIILFCIVSSFSYASVGINGKIPHISVDDLDSGLKVEDKHTKTYLKKNKYTKIDILKIKNDANKLINAAYFALKNELELSNNTESMNEQIKKSRGILIFPSLIKGGFGLGASAGDGVFLARSKSGKWSQPFFVKLINVGVGFQFGLTKQSVIMIVTTGHGIVSLIKNKMAASTDLTASIANSGSSIGSSSSSSKTFRDIITYGSTSGLYIGASIGTSNITPLYSMNKIYYNSNRANLRTILLEGKFFNPTSNILLNYLNKIKFEKPKNKDVVIDNGNDNKSNAPKAGIKGELNTKLEEELAEDLDISLEEELNSLPSIEEIDGKDIN